MKTVFLDERRKAMQREEKEIRKWWIVTGVLFVFLLLHVIMWWTRYQIVPSANGFYRINRFTGKVQYGVVLKDARVYFFEEGKVTYRQEPAKK